MQVLRRPLRAIGRLRAMRRPRCICCRHEVDAGSAFPLRSPVRDAPCENDAREVAMRKTILGSIAVIGCGILLMPLLVDTAPARAAPGATSLVYVVATANRARDR
jgi:hypothetical protein